MSRFPFAIIFIVLWAVMLRAGVEEVERRVIYPEKAVAVSLNLKKGGPFVDAIPRTFLHGNNMRCRQC